MDFSAEFLGIGFFVGALAMLPALVARKILGFFNNIV